MISVVIPIHNEEPVIPQLLERVRSAAALWPEGYELLLIDDGSTDGSLARLVEAARTDSHLRVVKLSRNFGHQAAISAGIRLARGAAVAIMDGDLQDPPEVLTRFLAVWREGSDVVYGIRRNRKERLVLRTAYSLFYRALHAVSDVDMPLDSGDFCVMDRKVVDALNIELPEHVRFVRGLRAYVGFRQTGVPYDRDPRAGGTPSYTLKSLIKLAVDGLFGFSMLPLRMASYLGFTIAIPSFLVGVYFIAHRVFGFRVLGHTAKETPGLATLAVGLFFLSGLMLIMLGIMGEYLGRIYIEVKRRPPFLVDYVFENNKRIETAATTTKAIADRTTAVTSEAGL
jgi:dolichol-phosphate mannosyltransferase